MALVLADRVKVRSQTAGTGTITLADTALGFQSFEAVGSGNDTYYGIIDNVGNWEIGQGTYTKVLTVETLSRNTVISSSNNNNKVNFPVGGKNVFGTFPSSLAQIIAGNASDTFKTIEVSGQSSVVAENSADTLTLVAGNNITITTDATADTITFNSTVTPAEGDTTSGNARVVFYDGTLKSTSRLTIDPTASMLVINGNQGAGGITFPDSTVQTTAYTGSVGDLRSESNINIDINLSDSTLHRWQFGEDGILTLPPEGTISNSGNNWTFGSDGTLSYPRSALQSDTNTVTCAGNSSTVIYTTSANDQNTIKLLIQVEGDEGASSEWDTQACEMIVAKSWRANDIASTVYGIVHTSVAPLATFTAEWNPLISRIEILCTTPSANAVYVRTFATEIQTAP